MNDYTVHRYGTDVYGRPIYQTAYYHAWEQARWANLGFSLNIAQGGFMTRDGGGATQSGGAHDEGGCTDYIIDGLNTVKSTAAVREFRKHGGAAYRRGPDAKHGEMPLHMHNTLGTDRPVSPMAELLWSSYLAGGDALAATTGRPADAPDYEWRPSPLVTTPPLEDDMTTEELIAALNSKAGQDAIQNAVRATIIPDVPDPDGTKRDQHLGNVLRRLIVRAKA